MKRSDAVELICLDIEKYLDYDLHASAVVAIAKKILYNLEDAGMQPPKNVMLLNEWELE